MRARRRASQKRGSTHSSPKTAADSAKSRIDGRAGVRGSIVGVWTVNVQGDTIDPDRQLDFVADGADACVQVPTVAAGDRLNLVFPSGAKLGGMVINADRGRGMMALENGNRYSIREAKPTDNVIELGMYRCHWEAWFVGARLP
jgi:hypothetical protein